MSWLSKLGGALVDCISKPIDALCEWATEPLESRRHDRNESARASSHQREVELQESRIKAESEAKIREKKAEVEHEVKRVKEIELAIAEIDEWKKDKEFERMKKTTEAIMSYQEQLTKLNVNAINAIGHMQLELRERAQSLVYEKTIQYKELQDLAMKDAIADLQRIEEQFSDNDRAKDILTSAVDKKLANVIDTAQNFLLELNRDIKSLNEGISLLAEKGQSFIENHLDRFHVSNSVLLENNDQEKLISDESTKCLTSKSSGR